MTPLLKARQVASILAISPRKLWELTNSGEIRCVRLSSKVLRYSEADVSAYVEQKRRQGAPRG